MTNQGRAPYFLETWQTAFAAASLEERPDMAVRWLSAYVESLRTMPAAFVRFCSEQDMLTVREMVWAIPPGHKVLERTAGDTTSMEWARNYFNMDDPITRNHGSTKNQELVRRVWLHYDPEVRESALSEILARTGNKPGLSNDEMLTFRSAAWDLAVENGMSELAVDAATKVTLWTMNEERNIRGQSRHELLNAITGMVITLRNAGARRQPYTEYDGMVMQKPRVCARVLSFLYQYDTFNAMPDNSDAAFECLKTWLPGSQSAIALAQSMGVSYRDTIQLVIDDLSLETRPEALPVDITP